MASTCSSSRSSSTARRHTALDARRPAGHARLALEPILPGYWFQYEDFPALYRFRADHTGVRTTYPTGNLSFGTPYGFSWQLAGDVVKLTFPSGYTDLVTLAAYDSGRDFLTRTSSSTGVGPWYAAVPADPDIIAFALCA